MAGIRDWLSRRRFNMIDLGGTSVASMFAIRDEGWPMLAALVATMILGVLIESPHK